MAHRRLKDEQGNLNLALGPICERIPCNGKFVQDKSFFSINILNLTTYSHRISLRAVKNANARFFQNEKNTPQTGVFLEPGCFFPCASASCENTKYEIWKLFICYLSAELTRPTVPK